MIIAYDPKHYTTVYDHSSRTELQVKFVVSKPVVFSWDDQQQEWGKCRHVYMPGSKLLLVGGFNPFEKYESKSVHLPPNFGMNIKKIFRNCHPPRIFGSQKLGSPLPTTLAFFRTKPMTCSLLAKSLPSCLPTARVSVMPVLRVVETLRGTKRVSWVV